VARAGLDHLQASLAQTRTTSAKEIPVATVQTGKRYYCPNCQAEFIVTRGGEGVLKCGDTPLEPR
jgi:hypothetical protein